MNSSSFYVITGGPGSGKTTLLQELAKRGYTCIPEVAREIIREQMSTKGNALPWKNTKEYIQIMLSRSISDYTQTRKSNLPVFFDRGIPDTLAYADLIGEHFHTDIINSATRHRYNNSVFILPPWEDIYQTDQERTQSYREAIATYQQIKCTYEDLKYELITIPQCSVPLRADFITKMLSSHS